MSDIYSDLCITVQALRRSVEGIRTPLAPATGVAAYVYTHQAATAFRVLTDIRVRHLLADEVGLGKTVQALMILNALRYERPGLRALVVVPNPLAAQWRDEIMTRAHSTPIGDESGGEGPQYIRLAWEDQLNQSNPDGSATWRLADIDPNRYDVLIVDELHRLRANLQDRLVRVARDFQHLLLLTATPAFQDARRHAQLFAMLEPERSSLARASEASDSATVETILGRDQATAASCVPEKLTVAALTNCAYRRVIRTRRSDYQGVLPTRKHIALRTQPLSVEKERQALMWDYFKHLDDVRLEVDPVKLAKRVILSPPSLEQRIDYLRRYGHERLGLLERAKPLVHPSQGDSRADALVDLLSRIWRSDKTDRVIVAAQDNLTVDYLFDIVRARIPLIGRIGSRTPLVAARIRQGMTTEALQDLGGAGNETNENLELFQRGEAQVLFAPELAQTGLNLQCARILVLYSVPWMPQEVDQWIGRLDRIGNAAAFGPDGAARTIDIYTISQEGLVDERVVTVLQRFRAFERSVNLDGAHLQGVSDLIEAAALRPQQANWHHLEDETEAMALEDEVTELESALRPHLPWNVEWAAEIRKHIESIPPAPLALVPPGRCPTGPRSWDRASEGMWRLLSRADEFHIRLNEDPDGGRFQSIWYRFGAPGIKHARDVLSRPVFTFGQDPSFDRSPKHAHAFISRRGDITSPPRRWVTLRIDEEDTLRPLHFGSFGNALHDELVAEWRPKTVKMFSVQIDLPSGHPYFEYGGAGLYVIRLSVLDAAAALEAPTTAKNSFLAIATAATRTPPDQLETLMPRFQREMECAIEADTRWLRACLIGELCVQGLKATSKRWGQATIDEIRTLLNPLFGLSDGMPRSSAWTPPERWHRQIEGAVARLRNVGQDSAQTSWSHRLPAFRSALEARCEVLREEARDAVELAKINLTSADAALVSARQRGDPGQTTKSRNAREAAADKVDMTRAMWDERIAWIERCLAGIQDILPTERLMAVVSVRKLS